MSVATLLDDNRLHVHARYLAKTNPNFPLIDYREDSPVENTAGNVQYDSADVVNGIILRDPNGGNRTDTAPDATDLVDALAPYAVVGATFSFWVANTSGANTVTVGPGAGGTKYSVHDIPGESSCKYTIRFTDVDAGTEAYQLLKD